MHELPVTQHIIKIAEANCRENNGKRVTGIDLVVGDYSGFIGDSIMMYFDIISEGTLCEEAAINIQRIKPKYRCQSCGHLFERKLLSFACPLCGAEGSPTEIGKEFYIESVEIEK